MKNVDSKSHVRGESVYLDDVPLLQETLFACVYDSPIAHGKLKSVDVCEAEKAAGVAKIILAKDLIAPNLTPCFCLSQSHSKVGSSNMVAAS